MVLSLATRRDAVYYRKHILIRILACGKERENYIELKFPLQWHLPIWILFLMQISHWNPWNSSLTGQNRHMSIFAVIHFSFLGMRVLAGFDKQTTLRRQCHDTGEIFCSSYSDEKFLTRQVAPSSGHQRESSRKQAGAVPQVVPDSDFTIHGVPSLCTASWSSASGLHPHRAQHSHKFKSA